ncbi:MULTISPECIES: hypothetical protein [Kaistella]|jgi:hypothetical protein|uniref:Uncharacterized protein n=1 Tax=Kaistella pullorum TaxID=2763074 RepID=A0ABR8WJJ1_9FLAO|nr:MULTISPECIES: hypothetical protein [Kaistella]MBD8017199.1 hypothetical protein [Kaistella pullorum]
MNTNTQTIQGILSIAALLCLIVGFFNLFSPEINDLLYNKVFYVLIGASFYFQAPTLANKNMLYPMYAAAALCIIGAFLPQDSQFAVIKTIGLFAGVLLSIFNRPRTVRRN